MFPALGKLLPFAPFLLGSLAIAQTPFTFGNLVVVRIGDGSAGLTSAAAPTFLDEYTTAGVLVQSVALPTVASGLNQPFANSGSATSEGFLNVSTNGFYLTLAGYAAAPGTLTVASTSASTNPRVIAQVDIAGNVDTSTALVDAYSTGNMRSVVTDTGFRFWTSGTQTSSGGIRFVASVGDTTSLGLNAGAPTNTRTATIYNGQLYTSSSSGVFQGVATVGTGLPTTAGQPITLLSGFPTVAGPSAYDHFFANPQTLYVADDSANGTGGIQKWTESGGTWTLQYTLSPGATSGCRGLTGYVQLGVATLWATSNTGTMTDLVSVVDTGPASTFTLITPTSPNQVFRGVRYLAVPTTLGRIPAGCGSADIIASGNGQTGTDVITTVLNPQGIPFVGYGTTQLGIPFCNCTVVHEYLLLLNGPTSTLSLPASSANIGFQIFIQGLDFLAPGGCPNPLFTLTDGYAFTVQ